MVFGIIYRFVKQTVLHIALMKKTLFDLFCSVQQRFCIDAAEHKGNDADRREDRETAPHIVRQVQYRCTDVGCIGLQRRVRIGNKGIGIR